MRSPESPPPPAVPRESAPRPEQPRRSQGPALTSSFVSFYRRSRTSTCLITHQRRTLAVGEVHRKRASCTRYDFVPELPVTWRRSATAPARESARTGTRLPRRCPFL